MLTEWKLAVGTALELQHRGQKIDRLADPQQMVTFPQFVVLATPRSNGTRLESHGVVSEIQSLGFLDVFEKPVDHSRLVQRLQAIERERGPAVGLRTEPTLPEPGLKPVALPPATGNTLETRFQQIESEMKSLSQSVSQHGHELARVLELVQKLA